MLGPNKVLGFTIPYKDSLASIASFSEEYKCDPFWENVPKCADNFFPDLPIKA